MSVELGEGDKYVSSDGFTSHEHSLIWGLQAMKGTKKELEELFPSLSKELRDKKGRMTINSVRSEAAEPSSLRGYDPDIIDFLRRCEGEREGKEIINFMEKRGEISHKYAIKLRRQLKKQGIRSFGSKKEANYYSKTMKGR